MKKDWKTSYNIKIQVFESTSKHHLLTSFNRFAHFSTSWDDKKPAMDNFTFDMVINILSKLSNPTIANKFFFQTLQVTVEEVLKIVVYAANVRHPL